MDFSMEPRTIIQHYVCSSKDDARPHVLAHARIKIDIIRMVWLSFLKTSMFWTHMKISNHFPAH